MEEKKREEEAHPNKSSSSSSTPMPFSDEIPGISTNLCFSFQPCSVFDNMIMPSSSCDQKPSSSSFGFVDLLSVHDYSPSLFDWFPTATATTTTAPVLHPLPSPASSNVIDSSDVFNTPASPNSSSISSSSNEAKKQQSTVKSENQHKTEDEGGNGGGGGGEDQDQDKTKKQ